MIRALCLLDSSNKCIFHWTANTDGSIEWFGKLQKELSIGRVPKIVEEFIRAASLGNEDSRSVEYEGQRLMLRVHRGFLIIADADSEDDCRSTIPLLLAEMDQAVRENALSFDGLLSDVDTPGRRRLSGQISTILGGQKAQGGSS